MRLTLVILTLAATLPLLLLAVLLAQGYVRAETERFERSVRDATFSVALAIERELTSTIAVLRTLATSRELQRDDLAAFHAEASAVREVLGANVILRTPDGRQVMSTFFPWGTPLPERSALIRWDPQVLSSVQPVVTGHFVGITGGAHSYAVIVPVERGGEVAWLLHASFQTGRLRDLLEAARLPEGARASISDADRVILARSALHDAAVGRPANALEMRQEDIVWRQVSRDGEPVFAALRRLPSSGWYVGVGVPEKTLLAPLNRTLWTAAAVAAALVALALAGAWFAGRRLARSIGALAQYGAALERGQPAAAPETGVREVNEVGAALATSAARLGLMVHELNHRVRNTLATVDSMVRLSARHAENVPDLEARLSERIRALAKTHVLLTGTEWTEARLEEVLRNELGVHDSRDEDRIRLHGPSIRLPARRAVAIGMLVHELATNAAKYGALSVEGGHVAISWTVTQGAAGEAPRLDLVWQEFGGPPVSPPTRSGFGTQLIERGLARELRAVVAPEYLPEGLRFRLSAELGGELDPQPG